VSTEAEREEEEWTDGSTEVEREEKESTDFVRLSRDSVGATVTQSNTGACPISPLLDRPLRIKIVEARF